MSIVRRKLLLLSAFTALMVLGWAGCRGFFVSPTLTGITVSTLGSTVMPTVGSTVQLIATGNYDDGSHKNLTGSATFTKTDPQNLISLSTTTPGLVTAVAVTNPGTQVTVQAATQSSNGAVVSGTISVTAGPSNQLTITSNPASPISISTTTSVAFTATLNGTDVTSATVFTSSNTNIILISGSTGTFPGTTGTVTITGTDSSANATGSIQIVVQ